MKFNKKSFWKSLYKISTVLFLVGYNFAPSFLAIDQLRDMGGEITPKAAFAASYTLSSTNGIWTAITGGSGLTHSPLYDNEIRWGNPVNTGKRSGLRFDGKGETSFNANEPFLIGDFTHFLHHLHFLTNLVLKKQVILSIYRVVIITEQTTR
jgi:hypothetical protein